MFAGGLNEDLRSSIAALAPAWKGRPVYVVGSGNLTIERILRDAGVSEIHSNDVTLYTSVLGSYAAGQLLQVGLKPDLGNEWMLPFMEPGVPLIAHLLLTMEYVKFAGRKEAFHQRMSAAYRANWTDLHNKTMVKVTNALKGLTLASFTCGDGVEYVRAAPDDAVVLSFPEGQYEKLYEKVDALFDWTPPEYVRFSPTRLDELTEAMQTKQTWVLIRSGEVEALAPSCIGTIKMSVGAKTIFVYSNGGASKTSSYQQKIDPVPWMRCEGEITGPLHLVRITAGQLNLLRSEYLGTGIAPVTGQVQLAVLDATNQLLGAIGLTSPHILRGVHDAYLLSDFAIRPSVYAKLGKLIVAATLSTEVQSVVQMSLNRRVVLIGTHAFTKNFVSMKYRGVYDLHSRREVSKDKPAALYYVGQAGKWTLDDAFAWWQKTQAQKAVTA